MLFNNFLIICQRSMLLWYQARRVIVLSWTTIQRHKGKISSGLSPPTQFTPMGRLFTISAKSLIALEIELSFFNLWHSSFWKKPKSPGKRATWERQCWPYCCPHTVPPWGITVCTHMHIYTCRRPCWGPMQPSWAQDHQTETSQNSSGSKYARQGLPSHFCSTITSPHPKECMYSFLPSYQLVVVRTII